MKISRYLLTFAASLVLTAITLHAADDVDAFLIKARAMLGPEAVLTKVQSVRYTGIFDTPAAKGAADPAPIRSTIEVVFQQPNRQLIVITTGSRTETTGLDGYSGWVRAENPSDPTYPRMALLGPEQVRRMRANTWENLAFYRGLELINVRVEDAGTVTLDGKPSRMLVFRHDSQIAFTRWFDPATGQLLLTETDDGTTIREEGELVAGGLRFPKKIISRSKNKDGTTTTSTIVFDSIKVNAPLAPDLFAVPLLKMSAPGPVPGGPARRPPAATPGVVPSVTMPPLPSASSAAPTPASGK